MQKNKKKIYAQAAIEVKGEKIHFVRNFPVTDDFEKEMRQMVRLIKKFVVR